MIVERTPRYTRGAFSLVKVHYLVEQELAQLMMEVA